MRHVALEDRYRQLEGRVLLSGVQALVRVPLDQRRLDAAAGLATAGFVTGYPGSPLAGYDLELARRGALLAEHDIVHRPALNEELAATAVAGSQLAMLQPERTHDGVSAIWYGKAPGLDRGSDALRHGNLMGTTELGGVLVCVGDDPQATSSSVPSTSEPTLYSLAMPVLSPADPADLLHLGLHGIALSRASGLWAGLRISASVAGATQSVELDLAGFRVVEPDREIDGVSFRHRVSAQLLGATLIELESGLYGPRLEMARRYGVANELNRVLARSHDDVLGVVAAGPAYLALRHALHALGIDGPDLARTGVRLLKVAMPYPLDRATVRDFARGLREVLVVEDKRAFLETLVRDALYGMPDAPAVTGQHDDHGRALIPVTGEVDADVLARALAQRVLAHRESAAVRAWLERPRPAPPAPLVLARSAYFCSGCPHSTGVKVPPGTYVGSGSGCHGLAIQMGTRQVGTVVGRFQMGGEGAMWNGMSPFVSSTHFTQNLGDGTLAHSGSLAIRAAVAAGVNITYKILVNSTVAMTGGQAIPGGRSMADLVRHLHAEGVARVMITTASPQAYRDLPASVTVWPRERIIEAQERLAAIPGVTVLLHDQECAAELRRRRKRAQAETPRRHVFINTLLCEGCGDCGAFSNCLSVRPITTRRGRKTQIHQQSCNFDYSCLQGDCPALVSVEPGSRAHRELAPVPDSAQLAEPLAHGPRDVTVRLAGIGGTGVLTAAQLIAMAAHLEGRHVRGMDQTGIAQKGGAVISDLRISDEELDTTSRLGAEECDVYLGADPLVAADHRHLVAASATRTVAVMTSSTTPTGRQVADADLEGPTLAQLRARVDARTRAEQNVWLDAAELAQRHVGSEAHANVLLLGAALQSGVLGLSPAALERAIEINGVDVEANLRALRVGRAAVSGQLSDAVAPVADPPAEPVERLIDTLDLNPELRELVLDRAADLADYQDLGYARRYVEALRPLLVADARHGREDRALSRAAAEQAYRLMAYKDEYEVARLHLSDQFRTELAAAFGEDARVTYHLKAWGRHSGRRTKIAVRVGAPSAFRALRAMRRLRGRALDPFGHSHERRRADAERDTYLSALGTWANSLGGSDYDEILTRALAPALIRGFGNVRDASRVAHDVTHAP